MLAFLIYLLLFLVPVVVLPNFNLRFEPPKVILSEFLIELVAVYAIASGNFSLKRINKAFLFCILGLFFLSLFHLILSPDRQSLFGNVFRLQGTILFWHLLVLTLVVQNIYFKLSEKYIYLTGFLAVCLSGLVFGSNSAGRLIGSLGEPNAFGAVAILMFPFVFLSFKSIWIRVASLFGVLAVINFTESKSALIALGLELLFIILIKIFKGRFLLASIICFVLMGLSLSLPILERQYFLMTNKDPLNFRLEDRSEIWEVALNAGLNSPIFGSGLESVQNQIKLTASEMNVNAQYQIIDSAHNLFLDYWIWGGGIGVGLLLILVMMVVRNMIKKKMKLEMVVLIGLLTVLSFNPTTVTILVAFWWLIGRSFAQEVAE